MSMKRDARHVLAVRHDQPLIGDADVPGQASAVVHRLEVLVRQSPVETLSSWSCLSSTTPSACSFDPYVVAICSLSSVARFLSTNPIEPPSPARLALHLDASGRDRVYFAYCHATSQS